MIYIKKALLIFLGGLLVLVGVIGIALPVVHGTVFLIAGLVILSFESKYIEGKLTLLVDKNTTTKRWHRKIDSILRRWFGK